MPLQHTTLWWPRWVPGPWHLFAPFLSFFPCRCGGQRHALCGLKTCMMGCFGHVQPIGQRASQGSRPLPLTSSSTGRAPWRGHMLQHANAMTWQSPCFTPGCPPRGQWGGERASVSSCCSRSARRRALPGSLSSCVLACVRAGVSCCAAVPAPAHEGVGVELRRPEQPRLPLSPPTHLRPPHHHQQRRQLPGQRLLQLQPGAARGAGRPQTGAHAGEG